MGRNRSWRHWPADVSPQFRRTRFDVNWRWGGGRNDHYFEGTLMVLDSGGSGRGSAGHCGRSSGAWQNCWQFS